MVNAVMMSYTSNYLSKIIENAKKTNLCFQKILIKIEGSKKTSPHHSQELCSILLMMILTAE